MSAPLFIKRLREKEIVAAIRAVERNTSGELRVYIGRQSVEDPVVAAQEAFARLGMEKTRERNAVLIYLEPRTRKFAVIGDSGVHARCGNAFWHELALTMTAHFRAAEFTEGIVQGIRRAGELLAKHFPRRSDDGNELPDRVEHD